MQELFFHEGRTFVATVFGGGPISSLFPDYCNTPMELHLQILGSHPFIEKQTFLHSILHPGDRSKRKPLITGNPLYTDLPIETEWDEKVVGVNRTSIRGPYAYCDLFLFELENTRTGKTRKLHLIEEHDLII